MTTRDVLADGVAIVHVGFVVFVIGGFLLIVIGERRGWRWVRDGRFRFAHLGAVAFTLVRVWLGMTCPLWIVEDRVRAGAAVPATDRVAEWCHRICFRGAPHLAFQLTLTVFAAAVGYQMIRTFARNRPAVD